jgi:hypothetical protein
VVIRGNRTQLRDGAKIVKGLEGCATSLIRSFAQKARNEDGRFVEWLTRAGKDEIDALVWSKWKVLYSLGNLLKLVRCEENFVNVCGAIFFGGWYSVDFCRDDNAEVGTRFPESPVKVRMRSSGHSKDLSCRDDYAYGYDVIDFKNDFSHEISCAAISLLF